MFQSDLFAATPSEPSALKVTRVSRDSVSLQWHPPISDGGSEVTKYIVYKQKQPLGMWEEVVTLNAR